MNGCWTRKDRRLALWGTAAVLGVMLVVASELLALRETPPLWDLRVRTNEMICSHEGVNPLHVFNHEIESSRFRGIQRPDMPSDASPEKLSVHAYPPWHTTYAWFYGSVPFPVVAGFVFLLDALALLLIGRTVVRHLPADRVKAFFLASYVALMIGFSVCNCLRWGNYGIVVAGLSVLLVSAVERKRDLLAGVIWALMMVKPQVAVLFFWPLVFARCYRTIAVAVAVCLTATLWPAWKYGESPVALVLQIPQIGAPFVGGTLRRFLPFVPATPVCLSWSVLCFAACGAMSWLLRKIEPFELRFFPVLLLYPYWTYCQPADTVATFPLALLLGGLAVKGRTRGAEAVCGFAIAVTCVSFVWFCLVNAGLLNPAGRGWAVTGCAILERALVFLFVANWLFRRALLKPCQPRRQSCCPGGEDRLEPCDGEIVRCA